MEGRSVNNGDHRDQKSNAALPRCAYWLVADPAALTSEAYRYTIHNQYMYASTYRFRFSTATEGAQNSMAPCFSDQCNLIGPIEMCLGESSRRLHGTITTRHLIQIRGTCKVGPRSGSAVLPSGRIHSAHNSHSAEVTSTQRS